MNEYLGLVFDATGIGADRLALEYCSAAEGAKFAEFTREYTEKIRKIGPNPIFQQ
jgi:F420-non-reducing hydrogenase iron-sulfur subunit